MAKKKNTEKKENAEESFEKIVESDIASPEIKTEEPLPFLDCYIKKAQEFYLKSNDIAVGIFIRKMSAMTKEWDDIIKKHSK